MAASSLSVTAAAIGTRSNSLSSNTLDHHFSLHFCPFKAKPITKIVPLKLNTFLNSSPSISLSHSSIHCVSTAALDGVELNQEVEETEQSDAVAQETVPEDAVAQETVPEVEENENDAASSVAAGRLYVGNLPFSMTSSQLSEIFAEAGRVVSVEIVYDRVTDRSRGFAFVTMGSVEEAKEAIRLFDGAQIGGRSAKVNFPEVPRGGEREVMTPRIRKSNQSFVDSPHKIYAGNLSWGLTSQGLRDAFSNQPGYLSAKVIYDRESGRSRGFGFITFASAEEVESALNSMNGVELEGRPLRLNLSEQRTPATPPPAAESVPESDLESNDVLSSV